MVIVTMASCILDKCFVTMSHSQLHLFNWSFQIQNSVSSEADNKSQLRAQESVTQVVGGSYSSSIYGHTGYVHLKPPYIIKNKILKNKTKLF